MEPQSRYGRLTLVENLVGKFSVFLCDCGQTKTLNRYNVKYGVTKSCGCYRRETATAQAVSRSTHRMKRTPEYRAWNGMKDRCLNPSHKSFARYGGRGIGIHTPWINSFEAFYADMGKRPGDNYSLERTDNEKGYAPSNCRWATMGEQGKNRSSNMRLTFNGIEMILADLVRLTGVPRHVISRRLRQGYSADEAVRLAGVTMASSQ